MCNRNEFSVEFDRCSDEQGDFFGTRSQLFLDGAAKATSSEDLASASQHCTTVCKNGRKRKTVSERKAELDTFVEMMKEKKPKQEIKLRLGLSDQQYAKHLLDCYARGVVTGEYTPVYGAASVKSLPQGVKDAFSQEMLGLVEIVMVKSCNGRQVLLSLMDGQQGEEVGHEG